MIFAVKEGWVPGHSRFVALCGLFVSLVSLAGCGGEAPTARPEAIRGALPLTRTAPTPSPVGYIPPGGATYTTIPVFPTPLTAAPSPPAGTPMPFNSTTFAATATYFASLLGTSQAATNAAMRPTVAPTVAPTFAPTAAPAVALAPEITIPEAGKWFNSEPLSLAKLRGKPVLLVFWSDI